MASHTFENVFYVKELETMPPADLRRYQFQKIKAMLERVYHASAFYRRRLDEAGAQPDKINSLEEYAEKVPFMSKADLVEDQKTNPPWGERLCVPVGERAPEHLTAGQVLVKKAGRASLPPGFDRFIGLLENEMVVLGQCSKFRVRDGLVVRPFCFPR